MIVILCLLFVLVVLNIILIQRNDKIFINIKTKYNMILTEHELNTYLFELRNFKKICYYSYYLSILFTTIVGFISLVKVLSQFNFNMNLLKYILLILVGIYLTSSLKELYKVASQELEIIYNRVSQVKKLMQFNQIQNNITQNRLV